MRARGGKLILDGDPAKGVQATRPLCPYPQVSVYGGQGDTHDAASFRCEPGGPASTREGSRSLSARGIAVDMWGTQ